MDGEGTNRAGVDLRDAIALFEETTAKLRRSYGGLQEEVRELRGGSREELAGHVLKGFQNLSRITGNLLLFARKVEPDLGRTDLAEVVREAVLYARLAVSAASRQGEGFDPITARNETC